MRFFLLFLLLFLAGTRVFAQVSPSLARTDSLVAASQATIQAQRATIQAQRLAAEASAATDTVGALHRLYAARRQRGHLLAAGLVGFTALSIVIVNNTSRPYEFQDLVQAATVVFVVVPLLVVDFVYHAQYNHRKERKAVEAFEHHQLPASIKSQLREQFFRLPAQPANR